MASAQQTRARTPANVGSELVRDCHSENKERRPMLDAVALF
jgi:hypothetical protein